MPRTAKQYRLVPEDIPPRRGGRGSVYPSVLEDFLKADVRSARVELEGRKPDNIAAGLRKAAADTKAPVRVLSRAGQVYLERR
jgi:hypothetical protein